VLFLRGEPGLIGRARSLRGLAFSRNDQHAPHQVDQTRLCSLAVSKLASGVARDYANRAMYGKSRRQPTGEKQSLLVRDGN